MTIPLKSSQSKTAEIAVNKFKVWWYLMCKIHYVLEEHTDTIVKPFLVFCFGPLSSQPLMANSVDTPTSPGKT